MTSNPTPALDIWRVILGIISRHGTDTNSAEVIPDQIAPHTKELHDKLSKCECKRGSCRECVESRRVLLWIWDKLDGGF